MSAPTRPVSVRRAWPSPSGHLPRSPRPGQRPVLIRDNRGWYAPLIEHGAHDGFCAVREVVLHPLDHRLCRCIGCWCWLPTPMHLRPARRGVR